jgi:hypothetical protein
LAIVVITGQQQTAILQLAEQVSQNEIGLV